MAVGVNDFLYLLMRQGQYGQVATLGKAGDQPSIDLLASMNKRLARIWGRADWKWAREALKITLTPNTRAYAVATVSGNKIAKVQDIIPYDPTLTFLQGDPLVEHTTRDFFTNVAAKPWNGNATPGTANWNQGYPTDYFIDNYVNGAWQIIVDPVPTTAGQLGGYGKALLTTYTLADVLANTAIAYFPNDVVLDSLFAGCIIDVGLLKGMTVEASFAMEQAWKSKIKDLVGEQIGVATDNTPPTTRLPSTVNRMRRGRGRRW